MEEKVRKGESPNDLRAIRLNINPDSVRLIHSKLLASKATKPAQSGPIPNGELETVRRATQCDGVHSSYGEVVKWVSLRGLFLEILVSLND